MDSDNLVTAGGLELKLASSVLTRSQDVVDEVRGLLQKQNLVFTALELMRLADTDSIQVRTGHLLRNTGKTACRLQIDIDIEGDEFTLRARGYGFKDSKEKEFETNEIYIGRGYLPESFYPH